MQNQATRPLYLASGSPARAALLRAAGLDIRPAAPACDEAALKRRLRCLATRDIARFLARAKARSLRAADALTIGADQILVCDGVCFDKPADPGGARAQLKALRGRMHRLITAVAVVRCGKVLWEHVAEPELTMRDFSDAFLEAYLAAEGAAVLGSVGGYRIEGRGIQLFAAVHGEHAAIMGLPLLPLLAFLRAEGMVRS